MGVSDPPPQTQTPWPRLLPRVWEHLPGKDDGSVIYIVLGDGSSEAVQASRSHAQWVPSPDHRLRRRVCVLGKLEHEGETIR